MPKGGNNNGGGGNGGKGPKPPKIIDQTFSTPERPADGTFLGTVVADVNPSKSTWSILSGNDDAAFSIDPTTGDLSVADGSDIDYEAEQTRNLVVQVVENGKKVYSATVTINISDVNEAPSAGSDVEVSVAETVDDTTILASIAATDPDALADIDADGTNDTFNDLSYAITGGDPEGLFEIDADGNVSLAAGKTLDFERSQKHILQVTVTDGGGLSDTDEVTVNITAVNGDLDAFVTAQRQSNQVLINDGTGTFTAPAALQPPGTDTSYNVALGDLDGDGDLDAVVANTGTNQVLLNDGTGTFTEAASQPPGFANSTDVALGDLDGDGDLDAFVANSSGVSGGSPTNQVLLNDGTGTFTEAPFQPPGSARSTDVALGDLDGDGDLDAFVANVGSYIAAANQVLINDGTGTFTAPDALQPPGSAGSKGVALGDVDGDGDLDAFVANNGANQLLVNDGTGTFTEAVSQPPGTASSYNVSLGDLDGDGDLDAFVANDGNYNDGNYSTNQVLLNDGTGTFTEAPLQPPGTVNSLFVALGDLDGDGDLDAVVANLGSNQVLLNDGTGTFTEAASQPPLSAYTFDVALGDLDGDGTVAAVDENGLPNINSDGLLPDIII